MTRPTLVDRLLAPLASGALDKVDSMLARLAEGDVEAVSQALNTRRRLIDSIADEVYPPTDETLTNSCSPKEHTESEHVSVPG